LKAVTTAHEALRQVLALSIVAKEPKEESMEKEKDRSQSRLPKELLQTCIRPVLLNLREYTRLSVPLLRGLSMLLSLLSSWFNKTLGEKLLDHLQKWTDPSLIKSHKIWIPGEEPQVAAAIIDLFSLLPHASHFVEPLVKTTIKLEAYLPGFNAHCVGSPYRKPLARYLNKHCQYTVGFFFQRLKAPIYSELFQEIVQLEECEDLRQYLSGRQCSVMMLNVCFERPLAIIRSEKTNTLPGTSTPGKSPTAAGKASSSEIFHLHGIQTSPPPMQREAVMRQDIEVKKKKLAFFQQEFTKAQDAVKAAKGAAQDEAKRKQQIAQASLEKGNKDFNEARQRFAAEFATSGEMKETVAGALPSTPRPMNTESLELQHQGFMLVETLIANNANYLKDHNDVVRAFRWLWRSKGRYLRLQHEDSVSPRYHEESKILVSFLMNYAKTYPNDVDVLFELIRIFLQPATTDFSFVRVFLAEAIRNLDASQKKQVVKRFFALLAGESTEETKALSIQLLLFPLLMSSLKPQSAPERNEKEGAASPEEKGEPKGTIGVDAEDLAGNLKDQLVDATMIQKFMDEVLPITCGDRLKVELLRVTNLLLEFVPEQIDQFQNATIRFCWGLIKSEDALCKAWAYVVVCRLISLFETQAKYVLQVYAALLRSHQQEGKHLVRVALGLLVPSLKGRLTEDDFKKAMDCTSRIMFEDGSVPQLAHIWHTIVVNPEVYFGNCQNFVRYMVNSLNRLGLPPNSPSENRSLAVSLIALLMSWEEKYKSRAETTSSPDRTISSLKRKVESFEGIPAKKAKDGSGSPKPVFIKVDDSSLLDKSMVETILNFLVRLKVLLADPKVDAGALSLDPRVMKIFRSTLSRWGNTIIRPVYFEKVVSLCKEEFKECKKLPEKPAKTGKTSRKAPTSSADAGKKGDSNVVTEEMLIACLDIFTALNDEAPQNKFLVENTDQIKEILGSCFRHVAQAEDGELIRSKLQYFIVSLFRASTACIGKSCASLHGDLLPCVSASLEKFLLLGKPNNLSSGSGSVAESRSRGRDKSDATDEKEGDPSLIVEFSLDVIEAVSEIQEEYYMTFSSSLLSLAGRQVKNHLAETTAKQRQGSSHSQQTGTSGIPRMYPTPTIGINDTICAQEPTFGISSVTPKSSSASKQGLHQKDSIPPGSALRNLTRILRIVGMSDIPYKFSEGRTLLFHILSNILDASDNCQLLMAAVKVVSRWLLADTSSGALTIKERYIFLSKIASFDSFNMLQDVDAQPLADLIAHYYIKATSTETDKNMRAKVSQSQWVPESEVVVMDRLLVACLLNANANIRHKLLSAFAAQGLGAEQLIAEPGEGAFVIKPQTSSRVLSLLFRGDYEGLGGRCWAAVFVELLLEASISNGGVQEHNASRTWLPPAAWESYKKSTKVNQSDDVVQFLVALNQQKDSSGTGLLTTLRGLQVLAHSDMTVCKILFNALLRAAWEQIPSDGLRSKMTSAIETLLARPFHSQAFRQSKTSKVDQTTSNAVRFFVNSLLFLSPRPFLNMKLLVTLAENYNCWYEVLAILEQQYLVLEEHEAGKQVRDQTLSAMRHCYRHLGDSGLWMSLASESCKLPETKAALAFDLYGLVEDASEAYSQLVDRYQNNDQTVEDASAFELALWEERWVQVQREMCQQDVVTEFANLSENPMLMLESAWKCQDWGRVRQLVASPSLVAAAESGDPIVKMSETLLAVADGKLNDVENSHAQAAQLCLYKWQQLPNISRGSNAHATLLHYFHRLVEIRESGQIMVETANHSSGRTLPDLKNLLK